MTKKNKILIASIIFLLVAIIDIIAVITNNYNLELLFKPVLMITLVIVYLVSIKKLSFWLVSVLFFSFLGDVFLLFKEKYFVFGLASFLLAHILYIRITIGFFKKPSIKKMILSSLPFALLFTVLFFLIKNSLGKMLIPVIIYGLTIFTFGAVALLNYIDKKSTENLWLLLGALIFISSDSMIALNRFYKAQEVYDIAIITTYIVAQYLIVKAIVVKNNNNLLIEKITFIDVLN